MRQTVTSQKALQTVSTNSAITSSNVTSQKALETVNISSLITCSSACSTNVVHDANVNEADTCLMDSIEDLVAAIESDHNYTPTDPETWKNKVYSNVANALCM